MSVTHLREYRSRETVELLSKLLEQAKAGDIKGLLFVVKLGTGRHAMGLSGSYRDDPSTGIAASSRMQHRLNLLVDQTRQNTGSADLKTGF